MVARQKCCVVASKFTTKALAALAVALRAAQAKEPGAESLNAISKRVGIRKPTLVHHRDVCLQGAGTAGSETRIDPVQNRIDDTSIRSETKEKEGNDPAGSKWAVKNPGDDPATAPRKVIAVTVEQACIDLRAKGKSYVEIAAHVGISESAAMDTVERVLIRTRRGVDAKADMARRLDLVRIDKLIGGLWDRALDVADPDQIRATEKITKLLERRAKLLGLDAPTNVNLSLLDRASDSSDFTEVFRIVRKVLDVRFPGATDVVTEALDHYRTKGEAGVDAFLAGDFALPMTTEGAVVAAE